MFRKVQLLTKTKKIVFGMKNFSISKVWDGLVNGRKDFGKKLVGKTHGEQKYIREKYLNNLSMMAEHYKKNGNDAYAIIYYHRMAADGSVEAAFKKAEIFNKLGKSTNSVYFRMAIDQYKHIVDVNIKHNKNLETNEQAYLEIGLIYKDSLKEYDEAYKYLSLAAEYNNPKAYNNLGLLVVEKDRKKAIAYFESAIKYGCVNAMYNLGNLYLFNPTYENMKKALYYHEMACNKGDETSLICLAHIHLKLNNMDKAKNCLIEAAKKGYFEAYGMLHNLFPESRSDFVKYFSEGGDNGSVFAAQSYVAIMYDREKEERRRKKERKGKRENKE